MRHVSRQVACFGCVHQEWLSRILWQPSHGGTKICTEQVVALLPAFSHWLYKSSGLRLLCACHNTPMKLSFTLFHQKITRVDIYCVNLRYILSYFDIPNNIHIDIENYATFFCRKFCLLINHLHHVCLLVFKQHIWVTMNHCILLLQKWNNILYCFLISNARRFISLAYNILDFQPHHVTPINMNWRLLFSIAQKEIM